MGFPPQASFGPLLASFREAVRFQEILRRFWPQLWGHRWRMLWAALASLGFSVVVLIEPWPIQVLFDGVLLGRPVQFMGIDLNALAGGNTHLLLVGASLSVLIVAVLHGYLYYAQNVLAATAGQDVVTAVRRQLFEHIMTLSMNFHRRSKAGDLLMRLTGDIVMLREMVVAVLVTLIPQTFVVVGILVIMGSINPGLTLVAAAVAPVLFVILSVFRIRLVDATRKQRKREGALATTAHEVVNGIQLVQAYTTEQHAADRFKSINKRSLGAGLRTVRLEAQLNRSVQIAMAAGTCAVLWLGTKAVLADQISPGVLLVFLAYLRGLFRPMRQMSRLTQRVAKATACGDRVLEVLNEVPEIRDAQGATVLKDIKGRIKFKNVTFAYDGGGPVLRDVNLDISPGEIVALVGPSGAGKTTVLSLIARFFDPQRGKILIDDIPLKSVGTKSLRRHISFLLQETVVMGATVWENIAFGAIGKKNGTSDQAKVERAAHAAQAHDFITRLPEGYDTVVGEKGSTLSGGERQRIAIARAILRKAPIVLLDEPMAALDPVSERKVLEALEALIRGRTAIIVAHDLSAVLRSDRILFLEDGQIIEEGTHDELLRRKGPYAKFFMTQWAGLEAGACEGMGGDLKKPGARFWT